MKNLNNISNIVKRSLKRRVKITESLLVVFLVTGGVAYSLPIIGDINSERVEIDENLFNKTNSTIYINDRVIDNNDIVEINSKENGVVIKEKLKIWNIAKIENLKNYGMLSTNGGVAINFGSTWEQSEFFYGNKEIFNSSEKGIFNKENYGMAAINNKSNSESIISNFGLIQNGKNYGMYVETNGEDTKVLGQNKGYHINFSIIGYILNEDGNIVNDYEDIKNFEKFCEEINKSLDGTSNKGNYGMAALSLNKGISKQVNYGLVANGGDYGMIAQSIGEDSDSKIENFGGEESIFYTSKTGKKDAEILFYENENGIKNQKNYGMSILSQNGGKVEGINTINTQKLNQGCSIDSNSLECQDPEKPFQIEPLLGIGLVKNQGDYGMIGSALDGGEALLINEGIDFDYGYDYIKNKDGWAGKVKIKLNGGVKNIGNYGMVALTDNKSESKAINRGLVSNQGNYGMYSEGDGSLIENLGRSLYLEDILLHLYQIENKDDEEFEKIYSNISLDINGGIKNSGNYGMAIDKKGKLLNKGLIQNQGDYGIYILNNSIGENRGRDLNGIDILNILVNLPKDEKIENKLAETILDEISKNEIIENFLDSGEGNFEEWILNSNIENKDEILKKFKEINAQGGIKNEGNIGVYVGNNSYFINHGLINPDGVTKTEEGKNLLKALGFDENEKIAIVGGEGNNTITLGTGSEIFGKVSGGLGNNTLHFVDTYDEYTGQKIENNIYGDIVPKSFSHIIFGKNTVSLDKNGNLVFDGDNSSSETVWKIKEELVLDYHKDTNKNDYTAVMKNGKLTITTDKFNSVHINGVFLERDVNRDQINKLLTGNVSFESGANLVKHVGKNVTSTLAANSINMNGGTITQRVLDNLFVTNANRIEITNIFTSGLSEQQKRAIQEKGLLINGNQASGNIALPEEYFKVESIGKGQVVGWDSWHEYDPITGDVTLIFERENINPPINPPNPIDPEEPIVPPPINPEEPIVPPSINPPIPDKGGHGLQGGYAQSIDKYTQSNVDIINTMYIKNQGYNYARKIAFIPKKHSISKEQIIYPSYISDKELTLGKESLQSPIVEIIEIENGERYNNLQMAELFGDYGKYTGNSNSEFTYDAWGVTGGTFHRINEEWLVGASYGYAKSKVDYKTGEGGKEDVDTIGVNLFLTYEKNNWLSINSIGYSWNKHDLSRKIYDRDNEILGKNTVQTISSDFDSHLLSIGTELGYKYIINEESYLYPHIGLDYVWYTREGYKEDGGSYALDIDKNRLNTFVSKVGLMYEKTWEKIGVFGDIGWQHYFEDFKSFDGTFYNESSAKYRIDGLDIGKDIGYVRVGAEYKFNHKLSVGIDYTGSFRSKEFSNIVGLNIEYKW